MTNIPQEDVGEILQDEKFSIVDMTVDPDTEDTTLVVVHDFHPEDEVYIKLVSNKEDGKDSMTLQFEGPDSYTNEEAKTVLNEVMETIIKIIEKAVEDQDSSSGSGSASASASGEG